jgi:putative spermidine/putrescine transport system ATP-binding protein
MSELRHSLSLERVSKRYGEVVAVDGVSLKVERGQFLTLLGPSGSGKTTILMAIAGFTMPSDGEIFLDARPISQLPPERRNFGMVFQGYALFPHMTVRDNIGFPLRIRGKPATEIKRRVDQMLDLVQLGSFEKRMPRQLSGGQQQRVALARALAFEPDLLLLDEPLSALDKKLRADLQFEIKDLHRRVGLTFIYVTHDQEEALSMSDQVAILRGGRLAQLGSPLDLYEQPRTRFVADFLGKSNFLRGRVTDREPGGFTYECGTARLFQAGAGPAPGEEVLVALRPEKIEVGSDVRPATRNLLEATLVDATYVGSDFRLVLEADGLPPGDGGRQQRMIVTLPTWKCRIVPEPGRRVALGWDPDASIAVLDD